MAGIADVSDVTLLSRLRQSKDWLRQLWRDHWVNLEPALKGQGVRVIDATVVKEPGKMVDNGGFTIACDCLRLSAISSRLRRQRERRQARSWGGSSFARANWCWPTLAIAIRPASTAAVSAGADVCVRMNRATLPLRDEKDRPFPLVKKLKTLRRAGETADVFVRFARVRKLSNEPSADWCAMSRTVAAVRHQRTRNMPAMCCIYHPAKESFHRRGAGMLPASLADRISI